MQPSFRRSNAFTMPQVQAPEIRQIPIEQLDLAQLPPLDTPEFETAVTSRFLMEYASRGWSALITVDAQFVRILALPENGLDPKTYVLGLLQNGFLTDALPMLEALDAMLSDVDVAYNHGLCLSELGRPAEAITLLERALALDTARKDAAIALGVADEVQADFIFLIMEAYSLRADKVPRFEAILDEYGSLANCPESWRIDVVSFSLETRHGVWTALTPIKPKGISKKKRTIGAPEFKLFTEVQGRFTDLLSARDSQDGAQGQLH